MGVNHNMPQNNGGVTQDTGWGQGIPGWCSWVCLGNDWANRGPEWLPLAGTSALSPLIHSKEPQSNTQRHTVTSNNTAQSAGDTKWIPTGPKQGDRRQFAHQIWAQKTVWLNCRTGRWSQSNLLRWWSCAILPSAGMGTSYRGLYYWATFQLVVAHSLTHKNICVHHDNWELSGCISVLTISVREDQDSWNTDGQKDGNVESKRSRFIRRWVAGCTDRWGYQLNYINTLALVADIESKSTYSICASWCVIWWIKSYDMRTSSKQQITVVH